MRMLSWHHSVSGQPLRRVVALTGVAAAALTGCDNILEVEDPDIVTPEQLQGPTAIPTLVNGVVGTFQNSFNEFAWFTALITDELLHAGTFTSWEAIDQRDINPDLTAANWDETQVARQLADDALETFQTNVGNPDFESVADRLQEGIAIAQFYGGYQRVLMAEFYCRTVLEPNGPPVTPDETAQRGLEMLRAAEQSATEAGATSIATAARVGQARALVWLGEYQQAAQLVAEVPTDFVYFSEYSSNTPDQENMVYQLSYGWNAVIRASVGNGTQANRHFERWAYYDEWVAQGLVDPNPGLTAFESSVRVQVEKLYVQPQADMVLASGWEARMVEAEALLRAGELQAAEDLVNALLTDLTQVDNPLLAVNPGLSLGAFTPVDFTGNSQQDLAEMARARASGLWLNTDRQATLRRFAERDGVNLYPPRSLGDDKCFPIPRTELNTNPNVPEG